MEMILKLKWKYFSILNYGMRNGIVVEYYDLNVYFFVIREHGCE